MFAWGTVHGEQQGFVKFAEKVAVVGQNCKAVQKAGTEYFKVTFK